MNTPVGRIEKLISELCPDGVEYRALGSVCGFRRGQSIKREDLRDGEIPVIAGGREPAYFHDFPNRAGETIAVSGSGAYAGFVSFWTIPVFLSDSFSVHPNTELKAKYVYYFLKNNQTQIHKSKRGGGVPHVYGKDLVSLKIPIPPLPIQSEIVKSIDTFKELEAELEARKKQYEYYRDKLLNIKDLNGGGGEDR